MIDHRHPVSHGYEDMDPRSVGDEWGEAVNDTWHRLEQSFWCGYYDLAVCWCVLGIASLLIIIHVIIQAVRPQ